MKLTQRNNGFDIKLDNLVLFTHKTMEPMIFIGSGFEKMDMYRGNFDIEDNLYSRLPLRDYNIISDDESQIEILFDNLIKMTIEEIDDKINIKFEFKDKSFNRFWIRLNSFKEEKIYGLGEQMSYFNLKGKKFPIWTSEPGVGRDKTTYVTWRSDVENKAGGDYYWSNFPQATYISKSGYYFHLNSTAYSIFDFRADDYIEVEIWDLIDSITLGTAPSLKETHRKLTNLLGRQPKLPEWVYNGLIIGAQGGSKRVGKILKASLQNGIEVSAVWSQDWCGRKVTSFGKRVKWSWEYDSTYDPDLKEFIKNINEESIEYLGYINPYILEGTPLYEEGENSGYFATNIDGGKYLVDFGEFYCGVVDFTNPKAFEWYKNIIKNNLIDFGMKGWMADFGEYLPIDVKLYNNNHAKIEHNNWPVLWAKCNYEAVKESGNLEEIVYFMRAGGAGSQKYCALLWAGDQSVDFSIHDGLISVVRGAISSAMTGMSITHSDIGGYTSLFGNVRTKELFLRWTEMAAFSPVMRTHEGNRPEENFQFYEDLDTMKFLARFTKIYKAMKDYIKYNVEQASNYGVPVQKPLILNYEDDEIAELVDTEYLFGDDILVAPIYQEKSDSREVYLPDENWIHIWSGKEYTKGNYQIRAEIGYPPVFYKKESNYSYIFEKIRDINN